MSIFKTRFKSMLPEEAMQKLTEAAEIVQLREGVKPHEKKRVDEAFGLLSKPRLLSKPELQPVSRREDRQENYRQVLERVQKSSGNQMVTLCAIGLGQTSIAAMKEVVRLRLRVQIQNKKAQLESGALRRIADAYSGKAPNERQPEATNAAPQAEQPFQNPDHNPLPVRQSPIVGHEPGENRPPAGPFSGRVFQLTFHDALSALRSEHVHGGAWLTEPYNTGTLPFITFSISEDLSQQFALERPQAM